MNRTIGKQLRVLRAELGITRRQLCQASGVPESTLASIEHGLRHNPREKTLSRIEAGLSKLVPNDEESSYCAIESLFSEDTNRKLAADEEMLLETYRNLDRLRRIEVLSFASEQEALVQREAAEQSLQFTS